MGFDADFFQSGDPLTGRPTSESVKLRSWLASQNVGPAVAVLKGLTDGSAVFEGRNLEGVLDHVAVLAGHEDDEETDDGKNRFAIGEGTNYGSDRATDERDSQAISSRLERGDAGNATESTGTTNPKLRGEWLDHEDV